ncbi:sulfate permease [Geovibrio thiophilus]|uniref:Sulfate permease n=1 Tax=Geovibrio thiophilus TaxID=139438 RepID=A0A410K186_9BACT|nr:sulfate permease [Geovibrio thiophilus]QAR34121.1 sulfate permease [Geovibrio thiophilus]
MDRTSLKPSLLTELKKGYGAETLRRDLFSGLTVGIVAIPLAMAFAIASGTTPDKGLFTAVIAGFFISLLGGSRYQIGGPTGAFVIIIYAVIEKHGYDGLVLATVIAGILLIILGLIRVGSYIKFIPYPVTTGFTAGIALVIFSTQVKDFFGLSIEKLPPEFHEKWMEYFFSFHTLNPAATGVGIATVAIIVSVRRFAPKIPAHVAAIFTLTAAAWIFGIPAETVGDRFGALPTSFPMPQIPSWSIEKIRAVFPDAITIALLAGIESLLSAVVADGMTGSRHRSNTELVAQGTANIMSAFFGGMPATGAIARTATNIKTGARTPVSGIIHAFTVLIFVLFLSDVAEKIPLAALSGVLFVVAWDMSELKSFRRLLNAPKSDSGVLVLTFLLTVLVDLTVAVQVGVVLAALLFMKRMSDVTHVDYLTGNGGNEDKYDPDRISLYNVPDGVEIYEIDGPFFFGVADRLAGMLAYLQKSPKVFILRMRKVPAIDATGIHALEEFHHKCMNHNVPLVLSGVQEQPHKALRKFGFLNEIGEKNVTDHISKALIRAEEIMSKE